MSQMCKLPYTDIMHVDQTTAKRKKYVLRSTRNSFGSYSYHTCCQCRTTVASW